MMIKRWHWLLAVGLMVLITISSLAQAYDKIQRNNQENEINLKNKIDQLDNKIRELEGIDQALVNKTLNEEINKIKETYSNLLLSYERMIDLKGEKKQYGKIDEMLALVLADLAKANYASATMTLNNLDIEIKKETEKKALLAVPTISKISGQKVLVGNKEFTVKVISADLKTNKVVVDTAADGDCKDNCPVMPLDTFAKRSGAWAAINGPYFCPASYPQCADKKNSFDTLLMNKNKIYFNSDNNVYSRVPAAIFSSTSRFVAQSQEWGRDTSIDAVIAGQPLLVFNERAQFSGDGDPKKSSKGTRAFIGASGDIVYIGLVYNATVAESAQVIESMGIANAINLDSGGSIAMWQNGKYVAGPGRDLPFGIMLVKR